VHEVLVSVVIPALNEADNLPHVLPRIPPWVHEVILVDGYSTDSTVEVAQRLMPTIRIVWQDGTGKGAALRTGVRAATGEIVIMLDADGSTDPSEIPAFVGALLAGADLVKGSRFVQGGGTADMPPLRQWGNWCFVVLANVMFGTRFTDITYGYRAAWRDCLDALALEIDGWENETVGNIRAARVGLRVAEVPSFEYRRIGGEAKLQTFPAGWVILKGMLAEGVRAVRSNGVRRSRANDAVMPTSVESPRSMVLTK
jgi:glycosyltransferase involved in cell wall biosynthesis